MEKIYVRVCSKRKYVCFKRKLVTLSLACMAVAWACLFGGCSSLPDTEPEMEEEGKEEQGTPGTENSGEKAEGQEHTENQNVRGEERVKSNMEAQEDSDRETIIADWAAYFDGINGSAVLYDASNMQYSIYNQDLALTQRSPCSTFKIISSLIALEHGLIDPEDSIRPWSGEEFWNEAWNHDISFPEAFRASCVWYFRLVADDIGKERMQEEVRKLGYGNCDISDWEGRLNTNNNNRALTGFWIESSLKISPKEQAEVMERIFGPDSAYSQWVQQELKQVMLVEREGSEDLPIYGKTGMGMAYGEVVDAWFTGFAELEGRNLYFCVYLGQTEGKDVSSAAAREIAVQLVEDYGKQ